MSIYSDPRGECYCNIDTVVRRMDNIKMDLREVEWDGMNWIDLAQDRDRWRALVNAVMNLRLP
jgi:hypothetical protein